MSNEFNQKLLDMIPKDELNFKLTYGCSELEGDFLCFIENYIPIAELIPKDFTIVDLGCYQAAQCYLFQEFKAYHGIDKYDLISQLDYRPPLRFYTDNSTHWVMSIIKWMEDDPIHTKDNLDKTYFICSAVPAFAETRLVFEAAKHCAIFYPGKESLVKGINAKEILNRHNEIHNSLWPQFKSTR